MSRRGLNVGCVPYLNARPLIEGLAPGADDGDWRLEFDVPSRLAPALLEGRLDVALVPVACLAEPGAEELEIVPEVCISSRGPAGSVFLVSPRPFHTVRVLALDPESRTSNALARLLLDWEGARPRCVPGDSSLRASLNRADGVVRMGDKALQDAPLEGAVARDLGEVWYRRTGLPFVFAVWAARRGRLDAAGARRFLDARDRGLAALDAIARDEARRRGADPGRLIRYLSREIRYHLDARAMEGLRRFLVEAVRAGILPGPPTLRLVGASAAGAAATLGG